MATRQELQAAIDKMKKVMDNPKSSIVMRKSLKKAIGKAKEQLQALNKADGMVSKEKIKAIKTHAATVADEVKEKATAAAAKLKNMPAVDLRRLAVKYRKAQGLGTSSDDIERDAGRPALPIGKRISKNGNRYYEYRANRTDVKQPPKTYPKLELGGEIERKDLTKLIKGTNYKVGLWLPYRIEFFRREKEGKMGQGGIMVLREFVDRGFGMSATPTDKWSVSIRKYKKGEGGYYDEIEGGLSQEKAFELAKKIMDEDGIWESKLEKGGSIGDAPFNIHGFETEDKYDKKKPDKSASNVKDFYQAKRMAIEMVNNGFYKACIYSKSGYLWEVDKNGIKDC